MTGIVPQIVGSFFGACCSFAVAYWLVIIRERRLAGSKLREAFHPEIIRLHPTGDHKLGLSEVQEILDTAWPRHFQAVLEFAPYLSSAKRNRFMQAWYKYFQYEETNGCRRYFGYEDPKLFMERVNDILKFTGKRMDIGRL